MLATLVMLGGGCGRSLTPPTPDLLKGTTAAGGWWSGGCPDSPEDARLRGDTREAISPELTTRLTNLFPTGSDAATILPTLSTSAFRPEQPCENDHQVRRATFRQSGGNGLTALPMFAAVVWRVDASGKVEWIKGHVAYTGL